MIKDQDILVFSKFIEESKEDLNFIVQNPENYQDGMRKLYSKHEFGDEYEEVHDFFVRVEENHKDLLHNKEKGIPTKSWLQQRLTVYSEEQPTFVHDLLENIEREIFLEVVDTSTSTETEVKRGTAKSGVYSLMELLKLNTNMTIVDNEDFQTGVSDILNSEVRVIQESIRANIGDSFDIPVKEFITLGLLKVQEKSTDLTLQSLNASQIASMVDSSYTTLKVGYHLANGSMKMSSVTEYLVDRTASRIEALVCSTLKRTGEKTGAVVGRIIGGVLGPTGAVLGGFIGTSIGGMVGEKIGEKISEGIQKMVPIAKEKINQAFGKVSSAIGNGLNKIMSFLGG